MFEAVIISGTCTLSQIARRRHRYVVHVVLVLVVVKLPAATGHDQGPVQWISLYQELCITRSVSVLSFHPRYDLIRDCLPGIR
jgi:hypothetical protein